MLVQWLIGDINIQACDSQVFPGLYSHWLLVDDNSITSELCAKYNFQISFHISVINVYIIKICSPVNVYQYDQILLCISVFSVYSIFQVRNNKRLNTIIIKYKNGNSIL